MKTQIQWSQTLLPCPGEDTKCLKTLLGAFFFFLKKKFLYDPFSFESHNKPERQEFA